MQYLSSAAGNIALTQADAQVKQELPAIKVAAELRLALNIDPSASTIRGLKMLDQTIFLVLESILPVHQALFSYFPADRALPPGDVSIQIGGPDIAAQLESHNSQPQTKFHRLKPTIINSFLLNGGTNDVLRSDFETIFTNVLKDRSLQSLSVNEFGNLSIQISEPSTGRVFDIDGMSSGEKGLILTFLLIGRSICDGGIILIDEPELHLNPAVCKSILPFLIDTYLAPNHVQALICSHSPEILGAAFDRADCTLLHLQSPTIMSPIYSEDKREVFEALRRLGTSASDVLFSAGNIFVEGPHDSDILTAGFEAVVGRYNITHLGGRETVEREIRTLQAAERRSEVDTMNCFIFDLDNAPSNLASTSLVKVLQWKRCCLENYLIDEKVIYDLLNDGELSKQRIATRGEANQVLKAIAMSQLKETTARIVYEGYGYENSGLRPKEITGQDTFEGMAKPLFNRLEVIATQVDGLSQTAWEEEFVKRCSAEEARHLEVWDSEWSSKCDGQRFFRDLYEKFEIKVSALKFKKIIVDAMGRQQTEAWLLVEQLLKDALKPT